MPSYTYEVTCTCDENCDSPCPAHSRENRLQDENIKLKNELLNASEEIEKWKSSTGLMDSRGDPDGVTPEDLYNEINHLRQQQEKIWGAADEALCARYEKKIKRAIDCLDKAIGDTDPDDIDYDEHPEIHAMHILLGVEKE